MPGRFPLAYDDAIFGLATHPQMLELHSQLLGIRRADLRFDHSLALNRLPMVSCHDIAGIWVAFFQESQQYVPDRRTATAR